MRRSLRARATLALVGVLVLAGCSHAPKPAPAPGETGSSEVGEASYYGREFEGRRTASGERYRAGELTAAHRTLPFGTRVRVTNLGNGRSVEVVVNDRGPHRRGRVIDVSRRAAERLGMVREGVARVRVEVLATE
ncbi:MAG: septal ring lytic transglycosylase RlpA family protein [Candidatus Eisenbacteria bacterium]